jgi:hypothetical protein
MKQSHISIAHEIATEYNLPCYVCGQRYQELHHWPKRQHKLPEILYLTLWPVCAECHKEEHAKGNSINPDINCDKHDNYYYWALENIRRLWRS